MLKQLKIQGIHFRVIALAVMASSVVIESSGQDRLPEVKLSIEEKDATLADLLALGLVRRGTCGEGGESTAEGA